MLFFCLFVFQFKQWWSNQGGHLSKFVSKLAGFMSVCLSTNKYSVVVKSYYVCCVICFLKVQEVGGGDLKAVTRVLGHTGVCGGTILGNRKHWKSKFWLWERWEQINLFHGYKGIYDSPLGGLGIDCCIWVYIVWIFLLLLDGLKSRLFFMKNNFPCFVGWVPEGASWAHWEGTGKVTWL